MATDEEKSRLAKLLENLETPEHKLPERCSDLIKDFHKKFDNIVNEEEVPDRNVFHDHVNPYKVDAEVLNEINMKLNVLLIANKRFV